MTGVDSRAAEQPNYDESAVRVFTLPDVLAGPDGLAAATADAWQKTARPHQFALLETTVYGRRLPAVPVSVTSLMESSVSARSANDCSALRGEMP